MKSVLIEADVDCSANTNAAILRLDDFVVFQFLSAGKTL